MAILIGRVAVIHVLRLHGYSISNACRLTDDLQLNRSVYRFKQTIGFRDGRFELIKGQMVVLGSSVCTMVVGRDLLEAVVLAARGNVDGICIAALGAEHHWHCHDQLVPHAGGWVC